MTRRRSFTRSDAGGVLAEFSLVFPLLITLVFLVIDVMLTLFVDSAMESALRIASRHAMTGFARPDETREAAICRAIGNRTLGFVQCGKAGTAVRVAAFDSFAAAAAFDPHAPLPGGADDPPPISAGTSGQIVVYSVTYQPPQWTPVALLMGDSPVSRLHATTVVRNEKW